MIQIVGSVVVLGCVIGGFLVQGGSLLLLWHPSEMLIIVGSAFGAFLTSNPPKVVKDAFLRAMALVKGPSYKRDDYVSLLKLLDDILVKMRKDGVMAIENDLENPDKSPLFKKYPHILADHHVTVFISDCLRLIVGGNLDPHGLESLLEYDLETHHREAHEPAHAVQKTAGNTRRLTSWVIGEAVRQMAEWRALGLDIDVAVNLSASDILDPQLGSEVLRCLEAHGVAPTKLLLEITESAVMRDPALAARHMQLLRVTGVRFAMDDFGTGYSSLSQLSRLPVDELKIDRSLIAHAHARPDDAMIVTSTIELAHSMGLRVVAEGVENVEAWNLLRRLGCDLAQGYLISKPLPPHEVIAFVGRANQLLQDSDSTLPQMQALEQLAAIGR